MKKDTVEKMENRYICPVCNFDGLEEPPYNFEGSGSYEICPCCGFEFGYADHGYSYVDDYCIVEKYHTEWRKKWIENGCIWKWPEDGKPEDWDPMEQLNRKNTN